MVRIDDLQINGLRLMQDDELFCFGCDAVELANFAGLKVDNNFCDLGAGNGIISIMLAGKYKKNVTAVELLAKNAEIITQNVALNGLQNQINVINKPMQDYFVDKYFDAVVCNPPYYKVVASKKSAYTEVEMARHEVGVTFAEVAACAARLLGTGGKFYLVHITQRLAEVLAECVKAKLEPKVLQILTPNHEKTPHIFLLECTKNGKTGLRVLKERPVKT